MANKKISELNTRTPSLTDLMLVGDPSTGYSYKATLTSVATIIETDIADTFVTLGTTQTISGAKTFSNNLSLTSVSNANTDTDKFLVLNGSNIVNFRTGAEVLSDIGAAAALSGTTNYLSKFTSSTTIGDSVIYESSFNIGINTTSPSEKLEVNGNVKIADYLVIGTTLSPWQTLKAIQLPQSGAIAFDYSGVILSNTYYQNSGYKYINTGVPATQYATSNDTFSWATAPSGTAGNVVNFTYQMILSNTGLAIGSSSPSYKLDVFGDARISTIANATTDTDRFLVSDSGVIKYRTGSEVLSDIGGASASSISGTTNYIPKFTSSSAIGNSVIYESSGGSIGIGTSNPSEKFSLYGGDAIFTQYTGTGNGSSFKIINSTTTTDGTTLQASYFGSGGFGPLKFEVGGSEQMRLTSTGLGIGTSSPAYKLDVIGSFNFRTSSIDLNYSSGILYHAGGSGSYYQYISGANYLLSNRTATGSLLFGTNDTERMRIDASGNLGLGVTPSAWSGLASALQVQRLSFITSSSGANDSYMSSNAYYDGGWKYIGTGYSVQSVFNANGDFRWLTAPSGTAGNTISFTQAMTLDASGNLLIGATGTAYAKVQINKSGAGFQDALILENTNTAAANLGTALTFAGVGSVSQTVIRSAWDGASTTDAYMSFLTRGSNTVTERMRITSGGDVGIGTTTPGAKLEVNGAIKTAAPTGGTAKPWKLGGVISATVDVDYGAYVQVEIDGTAYKLALAVIP